MIFLDDLGVLGLGSRLKRLSDVYYRQIDEVYKSENINVNSRSIPLLQLLNENDSMSVTELAKVLGQTHPAISQMSKKLEDKGFVYHFCDGEDDRKRLLSVTPAGFELLDKLAPLWNDIKMIFGRLLVTSGGNLLQNMELLERQFEKQNLNIRISDLRKERLTNSVEIIKYEDKHANDFYQLNRQWLEKYFYLEELDEKVLSDPFKHIINPGGFIMMACLNKKIVGTVALMVNNGKLLELTKMAVSPNYQGLGIGEKLAKAAIQQFEEADFDSLYLESNRQLVPALNLYDKLGFKEQDRPFKQPHYSRADIYMEYSATA
ncbi:MAG: DNA-binding MarR family transcriptional regulator [Polaribacter sp.]|jgi:DNA-binding MarR family transcriptional regulator